MPSRPDQPAARPLAGDAAPLDLRPGRFGRLFRRAVEAPSATSQAGRRRRSDLVVAGLGIMLGFGCAVFPWYIFFNQDKFGIRALKFEGNGDQTPPITLGPGGQRIGAPMTAEDIPPMPLDDFATGTIGLADGADDEPDPHSDLANQPFPGGPEPEYRMVYAAVGRAMIADETGMWVVQRGSLLPDNSKVSAIEQRDGKWVLVTSDEKVVELSSQ